MNEFQGKNIRWQDKYFFVVNTKEKMGHANEYAIFCIIRKNIMNQKRYDTVEQAIHAAKGMTRRRERKLEKLLLGE